MPTGLSTLAQPKELPVSLPPDSGSLKLSYAPGFYASTIGLKVGNYRGQLYYTTDGRVPDVHAPLYKDRIVVDQSMALRFREKRPEGWSDTVYTATYFVDFLTDFMVVSLTTDPHHIWDPQTGIYPGSFDFNEEGEMIRVGNSWNKWERPVHVELFESDKHLVLSQGAALRMFGGVTRGYMEKSLRVVARKRHGPKRFYYPVFPERSYGEYKSLVLRTSGQDYCRTRFLDALSTRLVKGLGIDVQAYRPSILFVNGQYWGIYNLRERIDQHLVENLHDADEDITDILQGYKVVDHGSEHEYEQMLLFVKRHPLEVDSNYQGLSQMMDMRNYMNYKLTQIYLNNADSRGNIRYWRAGNLDGRFRWVLYDTDFGFGRSIYPQDNYLADCLDPKGDKWYNPRWSTFLLRMLVRNTEFRNAFINQAAHLLNTNFHRDTVINKINYFHDMLAHEMPRHFNRRIGTIERWELEVERLRRFADIRPRYMRKHFAEVFDLQGNYYLSVETNAKGRSGVLLHGNVMSTQNYGGMYFKNIPMYIEARDGLFQVFDHWEYKNITVKDARGPVIRFLPTADSIHVKAVFKPRPVSKWEGRVLINELDPTGRKGTAGDWLELYNRSDSDADLSGWIISDGANQYRIANGLVLKAHSYHVFCADTHAFDIYRPDTIKRSGNLGFGIDRNGEPVVLIDSERKLADLVMYRDSLFGVRYPDSAFVLALRAPFLDNSLPGSWEVEYRGGTPGRNNGYAQAYRQGWHDLFQGLLFFLLFVNIFVIIKTIRDLLDSPEI